MKNFLQDKKKGKSLAQQIADAINPAPKNLDPEDDVDVPSFVDLDGIYDAEEGLKPRSFFVSSFLYGLKLSVFENYLILFSFNS